MLRRLIAPAIGAALLGLAAGCGTPASGPTTGHRGHGGGGTSSTTSSTTSTSSTSTTVAVPGPTGKPVPPGFSPTAFSAVSNTTWWLLGDTRCSRATCRSIVRTTNGGRTFVAIAAPPAGAPSTTGGEGVDELAFANPLDGYAFGGALYSTHDGGQRWIRVAVAGRVSEVATSGGEAYAVSLPASAGGKAELLRSPVSHDDWVTVPAAGAVSGGLGVQDHVVVVQSATSGTAAGGKVLVSDDAGGSFASYASPVNGLPCQFQPLSALVIWAHCATGMMSGAWRSTDGGRHFTTVPGRPQPNSAAFGAASAAVAVEGFSHLYLITPRSSRPVGPAGYEWRYIGFTDPTDGVALGTRFTGGSAYVVFYTTDGGSIYHAIRIR